MGKYVEAVNTGIHICKSSIVKSETKEAIWSKIDEIIHNYTRIIQVEGIMSISIQIPLTKYKFGQEVTVFCDILSPFSVKILNVDKISMFFSGERTASTSHSSLTNRILVGTTENFELIPEINTIEIKF